MNGNNDSRDCETGYTAMDSLRGKVAIITGASSGIGTGIALYFAKHGVRLSLGGRKQNNLEAVAKSTGLSENDILTTLGDIVKNEDRQNLIDRTKAKFGKIDILVNNAGIYQTSLLADVVEEHYDAIFNTNLKAQIFLTKLAIPHLVETKGAIVNISSVGSDMLCKTEGIYSMSKIALDAYTKTLAAELGPKGVRVNAINPGFVPTNIYQTNTDPDKVDIDWIAETPLQKSGTPEEIGQIAAFLASDMASFVTGELLFADGGLRLGK